MDEQRRKAAEDLDMAADRVHARDYDTAIERIQDAVKAIEELREQGR